jgi:molybdopterin-guanine dinucleotide biosynthesis protein B
VLKVVGFVGYRNSGKTALIQALCPVLRARGYRVAVIKHTSHDLDVAGKDTAMLRDVADRVGLVSQGESAVFWPKPLRLEELIPYLDADIVLAEGFKADKTFPKIVCLRDQPYSGEDRLSDLLDGLTLCAVGPVESLEGADVPCLCRDEIDKIADLVEQRAFKLPGLDCEACGEQQCADLARKIATGTRNVDDCVSLHPTTEVTIDGQPMPLSPFVSSIIRSAVLGMLSTLKGFRQGKVQISTE